jgi:S-adenosyl methyltransferase
MPPDSKFAGIDPSRPNVARVYDVLAGGRDNFSADRAEAERLLAACPELSGMVRDNRAFLGRAVTWAASQGIAQFLDLGTGLPLRPAVHERARAVTPDARVAYVDNDPMACSHVRALLATDEGVQSARADLTDASAVLGHEAVKAVIDPAESVCVILGLVLSLMPAGQAREVVAGYADLVVPGSLVALSCWHFADDEVREQLAAAFTSADLHNHAEEDLAAFLGGLELVPPGIAPAAGLRPGQSRGALVLAPGLACVLAAVARKS